MIVRFNGKIQIQKEYDIYVKVLSTHDTNDGNYLLMIPGGPGFSHKVFLPWVDAFSNQLDPNKPVHFILPDLLNCGQSDLSTDPENEFTIPFYAESACRVVKGIYDKLDLKHKMQLDVMGGSAGAIVVMNMPIQRPEWINDDNSNIKLNKIFSLSGPTSWKSIESSTDYVKEHYDEQHASQYIGIMERLNKGEITSKDDYIQNIVFGLGPLYTIKYEDFDKTWMGWFLLKYTNTAMQLLYLLGCFSRNVMYMYDMLNDCNLEVLNGFFKDKFGNFNLLKTIEDNLDLYRNISIFFISGQWDHLAPPEKNAYLLREKLPDATYIIFQSKHTLTSDIMPPCIKIISLLLKNDFYKFKKIVINDTNHRKYSLHQVISPLIEDTKNEKNKYPELLFSNNNSPKKITQVNQDEIVQKVKNDKKNLVLKH